MKTLLAALLALSPLAFAAERKPNFIIILADDLGYGDIGPFGSKKNRTPHLDRLASEGAKLTSFYAAPVCTPSRAQILTGSYAKRVSLPNVIFPAATVGLSPTEPTIASILKSQNYATAAIGKWHLGDHPHFLPTAHGFDSYLGLPYSNDMGDQPKPLRKITEPPLPLVKDTTVIQTVTAEDQDSLTSRYTEAALTFIRDNQDRPFFLYLPHTAVHIPLHPGKTFRGKSSNGLYGDWVEEVDHSVGRIADTLRNLKLDSHTLLIFTSDNGPWLTQGDHGGESGPLRGGKGGTFEGGVRVPTLAWWPGKIPPGLTIDAIAANFELLPTFAALSQASLPPHHRIDGADISPLLLGKTKESPRNTHLYFSANQLQAIRSGPWKLALTKQSEANGKPDPNPSQPFTPTLYHLENDLGETTNLADQHPEIVAQLTAIAAQTDNDLGRSGTGPGVRPPGRVEKPIGLWHLDQAPSAAEIAAHYDGKPLAELLLGETLSSLQAPRIAQKPFTISLDLTPTSSTGIILAHGGSLYGYALHLQQKHLHFTVRIQKPYTLSVPIPDKPSFHLQARIDQDCQMSLAIDGKTLATTELPSLIPQHPMEDFALGHDNAAPVGNYPTSDTFQGKIRNLRITQP